MADVANKRAQEVECGSDRKRARAITVSADARQDLRRLAHMAVDDVLASDASCVVKILALRENLRKKKKM